MWSADRQRIAFQSDREGDLAVFWQRADGTGVPERLTKPEQETAHIPDSWSRDGDHLAVTVDQRIELFARDALVAGGKDHRVRQCEVGRVAHGRLLARRPMARLLIVGQRSGGHAGLCAAIPSNGRAVSGLRQDCRQPASSALVARWQGTFLYPACRRLRSGQGHHRSPPLRSAIPCRFRGCLRQRRQRSRGHSTSRRLARLSASSPAVRRQPRRQTCP